MSDDVLSARYPTDLSSWKALKKHYRGEMKSRSLSELFKYNRNRYSTYSIQAGDLFLDYSKNFINSKTRRLLVSLARETRVASAVESMFSGAPINNTENRSVLHVALRAKSSDKIGTNVSGVREIPHTLDQMYRFVTGVQQGHIRGKTGQRLTDIVNIGIGGSDLGAVMASRALRHYWQPGMNFHSVSNVDGTQIADLTEQLDPEVTLFVICSKTFATQETKVNAQAAREWIADRLGVAAVADHFAAASTNHLAMDDFGINPDYRFGFWDWVGGRYSIWSAVGMALALVIGADNFSQILAGGRRMDQHLRVADYHQNLPVMLALISVWYNNFFDAESQAILPYDNRLDRFPAFLQQLQMESSGKGVRRDGKRVRCATGSIIWGEAGSNAQHSFYQLLHQGTRFVPVDFLLPVKSSGASQQQQDLAIANCVAQSEALMDGYSSQQAGADLAATGHDEGDIRRLAPHKAHPGNRPSNTILFSKLTPGVLGQLIALYEHKVFVEGVIWGINPFDQYGVELGKRLAGDAATALASASGADIANASTRGLLNTIKALKAENKTV